MTLTVTNRQFQCHSYWQLCSYLRETFYWSIYNIFSTLKLEFSMLNEYAFISLNIAKSMLHVPCWSPLSVSLPSHVTISPQQVVIYLHLLSPTVWDNLFAILVYNVPCLQHSKLFMLSCNLFSFALLLACDMVRIQQCSRSQFFKWNTIFSTKLPGSVLGVK